MRPSVEAGGTAKREPRILVVYGEPPMPVLRDSVGHPLHERFALTPSNASSFTASLSNALALLVGGDASLSGAQFVHVKDEAHMRTAIRSGRFTHVIYYGHALENVNALYPGIGSHISAPQLADMLKGSGVTHFDILGCKSTSIAAELSTLVPDVQIGYLRQKRVDNFVVNTKTLQVITMTIDPQAIYHYGGR
jgi:hypothetical protein